MNGHGPPPKSWRALIRHNERRSARAALRDAGRARRALANNPWRGSGASETEKQYLDVLQIRYRWPVASLTACAAKLGLTKDTYAARLRRALKQAEKTASEHHQLRG